MAFQRKITIDRYPVCKEYIVTRGRALTFPADHFKGAEIKNDTVYGVVIDMPMGPQLLTTLVCYINGAANLYFNRGGDYSGAAQRYPGLVQATRTFVLNAGQFLELAQKTTQYELPNRKAHFVYLLTKGGIYKLEVNPNDLQTDEKRRRLFTLYQRVMAELRTSQLKDSAAKQNQ